MQADIAFQDLVKNPCLWKALLEGSPAGSFLVDRDFRILDANPALLHLLNKSKEEVIGSKCHEVIMGFTSPCQTASASCPSSNVFATASTAGPAEFSPAREGAGQMRVLSVCSFPILDDQGRAAAVLEFVQDVTAHRLLSEYREELALRDPTTGLYNRKAFHLFLDRERKRARRQGNSLSLCLVDIDSFKDYNERSGEPEGDELLNTMGRLLRNCTRREVDSVFRLEADTFALLLPETESEAATQIRNRIRAAEQETSFPVPFSLAICVADETESGDEFYHRAAEALYLAKKTSKDQIPCGEKPRGLGCGCSR